MGQNAKKYFFNARTHEFETIFGYIVDIFILKKTDLSKYSSFQRSTTRVWDEKKIFILFSFLAKLDKNDRKNIWLNYSKDDSSVILKYFDDIKTEIKDNNDFKENYIEFLELFKLEINSNYENYDSIILKEKNGNNEIERASLDIDSILSLFSSNPILIKTIIETNQSKIVEYATNNFDFLKTIIKICK